MEFCLMEHYCNMFNVVCSAGKVRPFVRGVCARGICCVVEYRDDRPEEGLTVCDCAHSFHVRPVVVAVDSVLYCCDHRQSLLMRITMDGLGRCFQSGDVFVSCACWSLAPSLGALARKGFF